MGRWSPKGLYLLRTHAPFNNFYMCAPPFKNFRDPPPITALCSEVYLFKCTNLEGGSTSPSRASRGSFEIYALKLPVFTSCV